MKKMIQLSFSTLIWVSVALILGLGVVDVGGLKILPSVALVFAILGSLVTRVFAMGVQGFKDANILSKLVPVLFVGLICYTVTLLQQTWSTAIVVSVLLGNSTAYLGFILANSISKK